MIKNRRAQMAVESICFDWMHYFGGVFENSFSLRISFSTAQPVNVYFSAFG
jgi:hypothetical protein